MSVPRTARSRSPNTLLRLDGGEQLPGLVDGRLGRPALPERMAHPPDRLKRIQHGRVASHQHVEEMAQSGQGLILGRARRRGAAPETFRPGRASPGGARAPGPRTRRGTGSPGGRRRSGCGGVEIRAEKNSSAAKQAALPALTRIAGKVPSGGPVSRRRISRF